MERSFTTIFKKSRLGPVAPQGGHESKRKGIVIPDVFVPIVFPLFLLVGAISIPVSYVLGWKQRLEERQFAKKMKGAGRFMHWDEFKQAIEKGEGTTIGEHLSMKGPFRLWWTPEDIPATSPHPCERKMHAAFLEEEFLPFFEWSYERFTHPQRGLARLVAVPHGERKELRKSLTGRRFVSICSFPSVRSKRARIA
jgi:hypothetical protein